ncbi:hypothetical protein UMC2_35371 [[Clostridium] sordellii]|uniref:hypothetical protein n=1 Tax=Paraclostridium sordellii TaxID=1505 RepID=UPI0005440F27|nr:hypothetical protein [Paeniclostridium sordellii]CEK34326.1 hypothetical protein UMC2_35371 [[Clostridium] sordellii] [Paeniclostridium sordellii]
MSRLRFRRREKNYTQIHNNIIFKTKNAALVGLYTTIQALIDLEDATRGTEKEFIITKKGIQSYCGLKDHSFQKLWNGLKEAGYLKQYKIQLENGTFGYEYELKAEPDLTTHHSLVIKKDGTISKNVPKNKIQKLVKKSDEETENIVKNKINETIGNTKPLPGCVLPQGGKLGAYNNKLINKVCMYVKQVEKYFELRDEHKKLIAEIKPKMDFRLFEELLLETVNKNKHLNYFMATLKNIASQNIRNLETYIEHKKNYIANKKKQSKSNTYTSKSTNNNLKTRFHNINQRFNKYDPDELEQMLMARQKEKFAF